MPLTFRGASYHFFHATSRRSCAFPVSFLALFASGRLGSDLPLLAPGTILVLGSPALRGQGSTIEDNLVEDTYGGRGVWLAGVEGVTVQRNVLRRTSNAGIVSSTGANLYPPSHGVTITDNALEESLGPAAPGGGLQDSLAAIEVDTIINPNPYYGFESTPSDTDFTIVNNYIADSALSGLWINGLSGGTLNNNLIIRYSQNPAAYWGGSGLAPQDQILVMPDILLPVAIHNSSSVVETSDTISATSNIIAPVTMTPSSAIVSAAATPASFALQTAINGFAWKAVSDSSWLTITSAVTGVGAATVQYSVAASNTGASRTGNITIAGVAFAVTQTAGVLSGAVLTVDVTHIGDFGEGQTGAAYTATVSNQPGALATSGTVTLAETLPTGLTSVSMSGSGWTCSALICMRNDILGAGTSYPPVTITVNVAQNAASGLANQVTVSGGGSPPASASDSTTIANVPPPILGPPFFTGEVSLGSGVEYLQFPDTTIFGYYTFVASTIFYHYDMGYEAFVPGSAADLYLYDFASNHWWYTGATLFPYLYDFTLNSWIYYFPNAQSPGHYTTNPRAFSNLTTGKVFTM